MNATYDNTEGGSARRSPGVARAYAYLCDIAASLEPGERLPGIGALARAAGVAPQTMVKASKLLQEEGVLVARPRSGTYRADTAPATQAETQPGRPQREVSVADGIVHALLSGHLPVDRPLPGRKELASLQGTSAATVAKALRSLEREGWVERVGRSYRSVLHVPDRQNTLLLIARSATGGDTGLARSQDHVRYLQHETAAAGTMLRLVKYEERRNWVPEAKSLIRDSRQGGTVLGAVVWPLTVHGPERAELLRRSSELGVPVAVFDDDDAGRTAGRFAPSVRFFTTAHGRRAGHDMGRYLVGLGHRNIAFLSASHDSNASQARLAGLRQACAEAGANAVAVHVSDYATRGRREQPLVNTLTHALGRARIEGLAGDAAFDTFDLRPAVSERVEKDVFLSLVEKAHARSNATAWVAFNDVLASWAIDWLRSRRLSVPDHVSVVGFDESPRALEYDLTSYDFGGRAALRAAVTCLLRPGLMRRFSPFFEAHGTVVARGTTATP